MQRAQRLADPESRLAIGLVPTVLASIGCVLFFLPILAIPISAIALVAAVAGIALLARRRDFALRWALLGLALSLGALSAALALNLDAHGLEPGRQVPPPWQAVPGRPTVPPPARTFTPSSAEHTSLTPANKESFDP
ncbi:MAG TPA: hypothetical protein VG713_09115 [Pirellulales bacterium]|nr:hypothetical protein [Pirellulales bacterium]